MFPGREQNVFNSCGGGSEKVPGEGTSKYFQIPGEGTSKRFQVPGVGKVKSREGI